MKLVRSAAVAALLVGPFTVSAQPRVVVGPVAADRGGVLRRQLAAALCERLECVPRSRAYTGRRPDFAKARRNGVSGILYGAVTGKAPNRLAWLALLTRSTEPDRTWRLEVRESGLLAPRAARAVARDVERRLAPPEGAPHPAAPGAAAAPPPPPQPSPPPPLPAPAVDVGPALAATPPPPREPEVPAPLVAPGQPPRTAAPPREDAAPAPAPLRLAVEVGAWVTGRELSYEGTVPPGTGTLQTMTADAVVCPRAYLEVFPAAAFGPGPLAGLGVFADYRRSVGFEVSAGAQDHSARLSRLSAGLTWRLPPLSALRLALAPAVSYERLEVIVSGTVPGLPDARLEGVKLGADLGVPIGARFALLLGGGWVHWTSSKDLVDGDVAFFPSGSASALEAEAGFAVAFARRLSVRLVGEYSSTRYSLDADVTGRYRATEATDRYLGGRASLRAEL